LRGQRGFSRKVSSEIDVEKEVRDKKCCVNSDAAILDTQPYVMRRIIAFNMLSLTPAPQ